MGIALLTQISSFSMQTGGLELVRLSIGDCKSVGLIQCYPHLKRVVNPSVVEAVWPGKWASEMR